MKHVKGKKLAFLLGEDIPQLLPRLKIKKIRYRQSYGSVCFDLVVDAVTSQGEKLSLFIDVKQSASPGRIREGLKRLKSSLPKRPKGYPVFATSFLSPRVREICREEGVGYIDLAGNCFLEFDNFYLEKVVNKNPFPQRGRPSSIFTPVSSRIIRAFLEETKKSWQVGELSRVTGVSLGQTSNATKQLLEENYIIKKENRLQLVEPERLLDAWQEAYKPEANERSAFYYFERDLKRIMKGVAEAARLHGLEYAITSFAAAALVAPFVRGVGVAEWYVDNKMEVDKWVEYLDLRPVEAGANTVIIVPYDQGVFYRTQEVEGITLVGNIQMYLDLYNNPARGKEQAEFLRRERLKF